MFRAKFHSKSLYSVEKKIVGISQYAYFRCTKLFHILCINCSFGSFVTQNSLLLAAENAVIFHVCMCMGFWLIARSRS
jgi:hypothetical protein